MQDHGACADGQGRRRVGPEIGEGEGLDQILPLIPAKAGTQSFCSDTVDDEEPIPKIDPARVGFFDQLQLPDPFPFLDLALAPDGRMTALVNFVPDESMDAVL
jgi:hypothetical protein